VKVSAFSPETILIVDDSAANLRLLTQMLTERGYRVRAVTSGQRALDSIAVELPGLILLDIRMKGMDGFEVCCRLKADPRSQDVPIIFISALTDTEDKLRAFQAGGVDYVTKPFQVEEVMARIKTHLALRRLQMRLEEANRKFTRELALASKVQCSFLPVELPQLTGWQMAARLKPAREMSGDFYDLFGLPNGRIALVMADVVDKGVAAALFMALSWSLIRTYAAEFPDEPARVVTAVDQRLRQDAHADQFVTLFYGILDAASGHLCYSNAGQNPPLIVSGCGRTDWQKLVNTGPPLGILDDGRWTQREVTICPGGILILYTDGITEAQNRQGDFYDPERLLLSAQRQSGLSAEEMAETILSDVSRFTGSQLQLDDVALLIATRLANGVTVNARTGE
jgi:phosphoserine phosphatase RsbU/P